MAFGLFKNPFESLSADNQKAMVSNLEEIKNYFFKGNTIVEAVNGLSNIIEKNIKQQDKLISVLLKRREAQMTDKDQKEMIKTAKVFGPALERIVGAIKDYSKLPEETVDKFILGIEKIANSFVKIKDLGKTIKDAAQGLMLMAGAIILFGLALIIAFPIYAVAIFAAPLVLGVVLGFIYLFTEALGKKKGKDIKEGAQGLLFMAAAIILFGISLFLAGLLYAELWSGMGGMIAILLTIGAVMILMGLLDGYDDVIEDGIRALAMMVTVIFMTGVLLYLAGIVYAELWKGMIGMIPILLVIGTLIAMMALLDGMSDTIYDGAKALFIMVLAVGLTALILYAISDISDELWQGAAASLPILLIIGALVGIMYGISLIEGNVLQGALALIAISGAMIILGLALLIYQQAKFTTEDAVRFVATVGALSIIGTLLGVAMQAGGLPLLGALALGAISLALIPLAYALKKYKEAKFTEEDATLLGITIVALAAIGTLLGNPVTSTFSFIGAAVLGAIGLSLIALTKSLKTFKDSKWEEADNDILNNTITSLVSTFSSIPLTDLTRARYAAFALSGIGNMMTRLAQGIQSFANMKFIEYEVKDGKIVPKSIVKLSNTDIQNAAVNFGEVVKAIAEPLGLVGDAEMGQSGIFSGGRVSKGVKALTGIGNIMSGLAEGIQSFANLTFVEYVVRDGKIVPSKVTKLSDTDIQNAGVSFSKVINAILEPISKVGKAEKESSGWFRGGVISKGIKALTGIGNIFTDLAKGVQSYANLTFTTYEVKDGKIVPTGIVKLTESDFGLMQSNLDKTLNAFLTPVIAAGKTYLGNKKQIDSFIKVMPGVSKNINALAENAKQWAELDSQKASDSVSLFIASTFETLNRKDADVLLRRMTNFTSNAQILVNGSTKLEKVADSFERIAEAFGVMKDNINALELERLTQVTKLMGFLDSMAGGKGEDAVANVAESIKQGMEALKQILEEIKTKMTSTAGGGLPLGPATPNIGIGPGTSKAKPAEAEKKAEQPPIDFTPVVTAINNLKNTLTTSGIKVQKGFPY